MQVPFLKPSHLANERRAESFLCRAAVKNKVFTAVERVQGVVLREVSSAVAGDCLLNASWKNHNAARYF